MIASAQTRGRCVGVLFHESESLGAGISVTRVAEHLARLGWATVGWFPGPGPLVSAGTTTLAGHELRLSPVAVSVRGWRAPPGVGHRLRETPGYLRAVARWLQRERPHVVHANSLTVLPEATVARMLGLPIVVQVHELPPAHLKRAATIRWAAAVAEVLIGVSEAVSDMLRAHAGRTPVVTVYNGVPPHNSYGRRTEDAVVGSVGYVSRTKGTDVFLRAAHLALRERPRIRFEHAGAARLWGDDAYDAEVESLAESAPLRGNFSWLGPTDVSCALARWTMFVLASRQEAFPLSTLEAMAAGLPVIATSVGGVSEQVTHLETGVLVPPDDPGSIAEWIVRLHDEPELRARLGAAARRRVRESFTLDAQAEGLADAYGEALRRAGRGGTRAALRVRRETGTR